MIRRRHSFLRIGLFAGTLLLVATAQSFAQRTYYINFTSGSDSRNGTTKNSAWQRAPGMKGWSGNYTHRPGDQFIFKGGVTWPASCFTMSIANGGTSDAIDYYGVDPTWYTGASWTRPVMDFALTFVGIGINVTANYVQIDNIEFKRFLLPGYYGGALFFINNGNPTTSTVLISNCLFRDWEQIDINLDPSGAIVHCYLCAGTITRCEFHQQGTSHKNGVCTTNVPEISFSEFHHTTNAILGGGNIHDNHIHDLTAPSDPATHCNAIETFGPSTIYNNLIHDCDPHVSPILMCPADSIPEGTVASNYVYNNVLYNTGGQTAISGSSELGRNPSGVTMYVFNNTISNTGYCVNIDPTPNAPGFSYAAAYIQNNHCITDATAIYTNGITAAPVIDHNLIQPTAAATAAGYTPGNFYAPFSGTAPTIDQGISQSSFFTYDRLGITRPQGIDWDVGAYEWTDGQPSPTPTPTATPPGRRPR